MRKLTPSKWDRAREARTEKKIKLHNMKFDWPYTDIGTWIHKNITRITRHVGSVHQNFSDVSLRIYVTNEKQNGGFDFIWNWGYGRELILFDMHGNDVSLRWYKHEI